MAAVRYVLEAGAKHQRIFVPVVLKVLFADERVSRLGGEARRGAGQLH